MTPDRTFVGSQTQGYLLLLSLFIRPALIVLGLFAAMMVANPIIGYIAKAFWAMYHANVTSAESLGWFIEFLQWKNWLIVYGFVLLPVMYMIFGLSQSLPDTVLRWIGAGISSMGETQATEQMRGQSEKYGPGALTGGSAPRGKSGAGDDNRLHGGSGGAGSLSAPSGPTGGGGNHPRLLNANDQGVAPQAETPVGPTPSGTTTASGPAHRSATPTSTVNAGSQGVAGPQPDAQLSIAKPSMGEPSKTPRASLPATENVRNAALALGSGSVVSHLGDTFTIDTNYDKRYSALPTTANPSVLNHGDAAHGAQANEL
jgi:hypothetical protein